MPKRIRRTVGLSIILLGCAAPGCGTEEEKPLGQPVTITPAMEKMKGEMMKNLKNKPVVTKNAESKR